LQRLGIALCAAVCLITAEAGAGVRTVTKVETYRVSGNSGAALMNAMERNGPSQGFLTRAIAQTRYSVAWELGWAVSGQQCRLQAADVTLSVNYRYPQLAGKTSPALRSRWARFMVGVRKHEETHGRIAQQMVVSARKAALGLRVDNDPYCRKAKNQVGRIVRSVYTEYEKRQQRFDTVEHRLGGPVDRLVSRLVGKPD
jgi:predicted secreted Zn-dependent protease